MKTTKRPYTVQAGFTIIELMVAMAVFSIVMLVIAVGVVRFTTDYYSGITNSNTQATARAIMSEISSSIQLSKNVTTFKNPGPGGVQGFCIDNTLYSYVIGGEVLTSGTPDTTKHQVYQGLVVSNPGACPATLPGIPNTKTLPSTSRELLGNRMRLSALDLKQISNKTWTIHIRVIYGDDDLLNPKLTSAPAWATEGCAGAAGSQFCAVSDLTTSVQQRIQN